MLENSLIVAVAKWVQKLGKNTADKNEIVE